MFRRKNVILINCDIILLKLLRKQKHNERRMLKISRLIKRYREDGEHIRRVGQELAGLKTHMVFD